MGSNGNDVGQPKIVEDCSHGYAPDYLIYSRRNRFSSDIEIFKPRIGYAQAGSMHSGMAEPKLIESISD